MTSEVAKQLKVEAAAAQMATPEGRLAARLVIFEFSDVLGYSAGDDHLTTDQREGQRDVGLAYINWLRSAVPNALSILMAEHEAEVASQQIASRRASIAVGNGHPADG